MKDQTENLYHYTESGLDDVWLEGGVDVVDTPYGSGISLRDIDGLHRIIGLHLADCLRPLKGKEVRFLRVEMDMSQKSLGSLLGVGATTVARWESGRGKITETAQKLLCLLYREKALGNAKIAESLQRLADLDAEEYYQMQLVHTDDGWTDQAA
jgi:DNA-binding transcriptional regulator YiaG